jgi:multidrug efflux pump subunit AcrA (membrane-fusion protein)
MFTMPALIAGMIPGKITMRMYYFLMPLALICGAGAGAAGYHFVHQLDLFGEKASPASPPDKKDKPAEEAEQVKISPQARQNLGLVVAPAEVRKEPYWRTVAATGMVIERPGHCDQLVTSPLSGIVKRIDALKGDLVRPGEELFVVQLVSEPIHNAQALLYKTTVDLRLTEEQITRLASVSGAGILPPAKMIDLTTQQRRHEASIRTLRHELLVAGLTDAQIAEVAQGKFLREIPIPVPGKETHPYTAAEPEHESQLFEVEQLKVIAGERVQAGQPLAHLADHHVLFLEGRVFQSQLPLLQRAIANHWPVRTVIPADRDWPAIAEELPVRSVSNQVEPGTQTVGFYMTLPNPARDFPQTGRLARMGKQFRVWRFRPGQKVPLEVPVEKFTNCFVLPAEAVVREGPETYVFRQDQKKSEIFERVAVHVLHEDRRMAVIANDGGLEPGTPVAMNNAVQLNWTLKAQSSEGGGTEGD